MQKYSCEALLGSGSYGEVYRATNRQTGEVIAIKKIKKRFPTWEECLQLRELKALKELKNHENIVTLKELVREDGYLFFIFEYMPDGDMYQRIEKAKTDSTKRLTTPIIRHYMKQIFAGLAHTHRNGFFHRDIKPENLLLKGSRVAISDFGEARQVRSVRPCTTYVSTRWYRAPELLLGMKSYSSPIDIWAAGCILAELYTLVPFFPGSGELDQLCRIFDIIGHPTVESWQEGFHFLSRIDLQVDKREDASSSVQQQPSLLGGSHSRSSSVASTTSSSFENLSIIDKLKGKISNAPDSALQLLHELFQLNPRRRPSAMQALQLPFFNDDTAVETASSTTTANLIAETTTAIKTPDNILSGIDLNAASNLIGQQVNKKQITAPQTIKKTTDWSAHDTKLNVTEAKKILKDGSSKFEMTEDLLLSESLSPTTLQNEIEKTLTLLQKVSDVNQRGTDETTAEKNSIVRTEVEEGEQLVTAEVDQSASLDLDELERMLNNPT
eukprot:g1127.t1